MKAFPDKLRFVEAGFKNDSALFRLTSRCRFFSSLGTIYVPSGFVTDGASIPRIFWNILSPFGPYFKAAVVHDYLYSPWNSNFNRKDSDQIFLEGMTLLGVSEVKRGLIFNAVRWLGWNRFKGLKK